MKILLQFIICFFLTINLFAQKKNKVVIDDFLSANEYLHNYQIEKFFIHTNKSNYYPGEKVWFKAYIVNDSDNKPSFQTSNLHINLYNSNKVLISNQLNLVEHGTTHGEINLPKELKGGTYYIELSTQWNTNFKNNSFVSSIDIIENPQNLEPEIEEVLEAVDINIENAFNINFFADSSIMIENVVNSITFTAKLNSNPIKISGYIKDNTTGIKVSKIQSNIFGMGHFNLFCRSNRSYSAVIEYNNIQKIVPIEKAKEKGILITKNIDQKVDSIVSFTLKTNKQTLSSEANNSVFAVVHRNGFTNTIIPIKLKKKYLNYSINVLKKDLFKGVNSISLFNKRNKVIAEYSFFNDNYKKTNLDIVKVDNELDSITLGLKLKNGLKGANLSISVLPLETKVFNNQSSILTSFLLAPYLENTHLNLSQFFNSKNSLENIDCLIKTGIKTDIYPIEGGSKDIITSENGMSINGNVSSNIKDLSNYKIMLSSEENNILLIDSIGKSNSFSFNNLVLKHPSKYKLALLNATGEIIKTGFRIKKTLINYKPNTLLSKKIELNEQHKNLTFEKDATGIDYSYTPTFSDDVNLLEVVDLTKKRKTKKVVLEELGIKSNILENDFSRFYQIEEDQYAYSIIQLLQKYGGIKVNDNCPLGFGITTTRGPMSFLGSNNMSIIVDGIRISDPSYLCNMNATDFSAFSINSLGVGAGIQGQGGIINLYTVSSKFSEYKTSANKDIYVSETELGFNFPSEYSNTQFTFANQLSKEYFGTIGWFPNFNLNPNTENLLKFSKNGIQNIKVIVNGLDSKGNLIFKIADFN